MKFPVEVLLGFVLSALLTLLAIAVQPNSLQDMLWRLTSQPLLFVMNALPILLMLSVFSFLLRNVFWGASLTGLLVCGTSFASRIKIGLRYEAVYPRDFLLLREVGSAMESYRISIRVDLLVIILLTVVCLIVLGLFFRHNPCKRRRSDILFRLLGAAASIGVLVLLTLTIYASDTLYNSFDTSNFYNHITVYNEHGFPYSFFHCFTAYPVDCPEGYNTAEAAAWDSAETVTGQGKDVHVIVVMNEAFSALTEYSAFTYSEADDPMKNFHSLQQDPHAISGRTVVADIGGGTSNTEFDVLTGMQSDALSPTTTIAFGAVSRNLDSLFRVYAEDGYATSFVHPSVGWFYDRQNTYEKLGAGTQIYAEDMTNIQYKGSWPTDAYLASYIEDSFSDAVAAGQMVFSYITTFQNHMAYTADKYGADYELPPLSIDRTLSEESETSLNVYIEGIRDADAMLGELVSYFSDQEEPVVLAFFGDHLPALGTGNATYAELGISLDPDSSDAVTFFYPYATPYIIWANDAGAEALDWDNAVAELALPENGHISACYLGGVLLELTGRGSETAWFSFLNQLRRELPVVRNGTYMTPSGTVSTALSETAQLLVSKWRKWSYYKLKHKVIP